MYPIQLPAHHLAKAALAQQHFLAARVALDQDVLRPQRWQPRRRRISCRPPCPSITCGGNLVFIIPAGTSGGIG